MYTRNDRLNALFMEEISLALRSVKDPGLSGFLTVTGVSLSADRKLATVYYSVFGEAEQKQSTTAALRRAAKFIRHTMVKRLSLKIIPEIVFKFDDTPARADRVESILNRLDDEKKKQP
ncbi:MAG: 30S ribosome-binding factor RbfA [Elusimicrobia bacterium]|nr:30S ribosome-binding factor RbfA [Elusimicrobiota bacterium]